MKAHFYPSDWVYGWRLNKDQIFSRPISKNILFEKSYCHQLSTLNLDLVTLPYF